MTSIGSSLQSRNDFCTIRFSQNPPVIKGLMQITIIMCSNRDLHCCWLIKTLFVSLAQNPKAISRTKKKKKKQTNKYINYREQKLRQLPPWTLSQKEIYPHKTKLKRTRHHLSHKTIVRIHLHIFLVFFVCILFWFLYLVFYNLAFSYFLKLFLNACIRTLKVFLNSNFF